MSRNIIFLLFTIFILSIVFSTPASAEETVITLWHAIPTEHVRLFDEIVKGYTDTAHGLVKVHVRRFNSPEELSHALITGKEHPDIALIDTRWQDRIAAAHKLFYAEDLIKNYGGGSVFITFKMDTFEPMWESSQKNNRLLSIPFMGYNRALIINTDLMEKYGIKKPPATWSDLITAGKQIIKAQNNCPTPEDYAFLIPVNESPESLASFYQVLMWQHGKDLWEPYGDGKLVSYNGSEGKAILKMMQDMINTYKMSPVGGVSKDSVGMFIGTPADYLELVRSGKNAVSYTHLTLPTIYSV